MNFERIPWWALVLVIVSSLFVTWFAGKLLLKKYTGRWPW